MLGVLAMVYGLTAQVLALTNLRESIGWEANNIGMLSKQSDYTKFHNQYSSYQAPERVIRSASYTAAKYCIAAGVSEVGLGLRYRITGMPIPPPVASG